MQVLGNLTILVGRGGIMIIIHQSIHLFLSEFLQFIFYSTIILTWFKKEFNLLKIILFSIIITTVHYTLSAFSARSILVYISAIAVALFVLNIYICKIDVLNSFYAAILTLFSSIFFETVSIGITNIVFYHTEQAVMKTAIYNDIGVPYIKAFLVFTLLLIIKCLKTNVDDKAKLIYAIASNISILALFLIPNILFFTNSILQIPFEFYLINTLFLMLLCVYCIYISIKLVDSLKNTQYTGYCNFCMETQNAVIDKYRSFKHDFGNILQVIDGYLKLDDIDGLKEYFKHILMDAKYVNNMFLLNSYIKNFPPLYGLLLSKLVYAEKNGITFNINVCSEISIGDVSLPDFCRIIGVLLDNALEAAAESEKKVMELDISKSNNGINIKIINTFSGNIDLNKIFDLGFTTKKEHTGYGLYEVGKLLKKYDKMTLKTDVSEETFTQNLFIKR